MSIAQIVFATFALVLVLLAAALAWRSKWPPGQPYSELYRKGGRRYAANPRDRTAMETGGDAPAPFFGFLPWISTDSDSGGGDHGGGSDGGFDGGGDGGGGDGGGGK